MTGAPYPALNGTSLGNDLGYVFIYANQVTGGLAIPLILVAFFLVVFLGSLFMQLRITGKWRFEVTLTASSFVTFPVSVILNSIQGVNLNFWVGITLTLTIVSVIWLFLSTNYES